MLATESPVFFLQVIIVALSPGNLQSKCICANKWGITMTWHFSDPTVKDSLIYYIIKILFLHMATTEGTHIKCTGPFAGQCSLNRSGAITRRGGARSWAWASPGAPVFWGGCWKWGVHGAGSPSASHKWEQGQAACTFQLPSAALSSITYSPTGTYEIALKLRQWFYAMNWFSRV